MSRPGTGAEPFFLVDPLPAPGEFLLDGDEGRHASTVRRMRPGEQLVLADGRGTHAGATVLAAGRGTLALQVGDAVTDAEPAPRVVLVQALPKGERSDLVVDLATEAGVDEIVPWQAGRCVARWTASPDKANRGRARWQSVAREAAKQSRRSRVPVVRPLADSNAVVGLVAGAGAALVLHESAVTPVRAVTMPADGTLVLVVGPEGGISPDELALFERAGARPVRLGPEVLRTSTAAAVALGALGVLTGRWS